MMCICLSKSLTAASQDKLLAHRSKFTFNDVEYAPLMYKIITQLTTMDSVATTQSLCENLHNLSTFAATVQGDIDKIHKEFGKNYSKIIASGATVDDPIQILFNPYNAVLYYNFKKYIENQENDYLNGKLAGITHEALRKMAKSKFDWLVNKKKRGARSPDNNKIIAMAEEINALKGQLKLSPKLAKVTNDKDKRDGKKGDKKKRNKKDTKNKKNQKRTRHGKRYHLKMTNLNKRSMVTTPFIGASTIWLGRFTSPLTAVWENSTMTNRSPLNAQASQLLRPQLPPPPSIRTMQPSWPLLASLRKKNAGLCRHG
jgi:hypothetical protein